MKILIADDDPNIRKLLQMTLEAEGYEVIQAANGREALEKVEKHPVDLLILDIMMPEVDGWQVCRQLQDHDLPIIMLTAKDDEVDTILGLKMGADDYVTKPFSPRELVARVEAVLRRTKRNNGSKELMTYPGLGIDRTKRKVVVNSEEIEISPKEFEILWEMGKRPGQVFSRDQLLDQVWGFDYIGTTRTVDVHIKRLRAKLEEIQPDYSYIQTVWGVGYKFEVEDLE